MQAHPPWPPLGYEVFLENRKLEDAWQVASAAVRQAPDDLAWRQRLARVAEWTARPQVALDNWLKVARATGQDEAWQAVLRLAPGLFDDAALIPALHYQIARQPQDIRLIRELVAAHERLGEPRPAIADLVAGHAEVSFQNLNNVIQHIKTGKLRALATTSEKRSPLLPDVPTMVELGYKDMVVTSWQAFAAPKGLPAEVKKALHGAMDAALKDPETAKKLTDPGFEIISSTPEEFARFLQAELAKWKTVIEVGNITLD